MSERKCQSSLYEREYVPPPSNSSLLLSTLEALMPDQDTSEEIPSEISLEISQASEDEEYDQRSYPPDLLHQYPTPQALGGKLEQQRLKGSFDAEGYFIIGNLSEEKKDGVVATALKKITPSKFFSWLNRGESSKNKGKGVVYFNNEEIIPDVNLPLKGQELHRAYLLEQEVIDNLYLQEETKCQQLQQASILEQKRIILEQERIILEQKRIILEQERIILEQKRVMDGLHFQEESSRRTLEQLVVEAEDELFELIEQRDKIRKEIKELDVTRYLLQLPNKNKQAVDVDIQDRDGLNSSVAATLYENSKSIQNPKKRSRE